MTDCVIGGQTFEQLKIDYAFKSFPIVFQNVSLHSYNGNYSVKITGYNGIAPVVINDCIFTNDCSDPKSITVTSGQVNITHTSVQGTFNCDNSSVMVTNTELYVSSKGCSSCSFLGQSVRCPEVLLILILIIGGSAIFVFVMIIIFVILFRKRIKSKSLKYRPIN